MLIWCVRSLQNINVVCGECAVGLCRTWGTMLLCSWIVQNTQTTLRMCRTHEVHGDCAGRLYRKHGSILGWAEYIGYVGMQQPQQQQWTEGVGCSQSFCISIIPAFAASQLVHYQKLLHRNLQSEEKNQNRVPGSSNQQLSTLQVVAEDRIYFTSRHYRQVLNSPAGCKLS